jgi:hypothetical protein
MASGHVNRINRPNTWPQPTCCTVQKSLANTEPSTHGTFLPCQLICGMSVVGGMNGPNADAA